MGRRGDYPPPLFCVGRDVFVGYFFAMRCANGDLCPFWIAWVVTNPNPNLSYHNQIQIQYQRLINLNM